jgi:hypothetical protein
MSEQYFMSSIKELKQHYFFMLLGLAPNKNYKPLSEAELKIHESIVEKHSHKIWNKDFYGLDQADSLSAMARPIQADLTVIERLKKDLNNLNKN